MYGTHSELAKRMQPRAEESPLPTLAPVPAGEEAAAGRRPNQIVNKGVFGTASSVLYRTVLHCAVALFIEAAPSCCIYSQREEVRSR